MPGMPHAPAPHPPPDGIQASEAADPLTDAAKVEYWRSTFSPPQLGQAIAGADDRTSFSNWLPHEQRYSKIGIYSQFNLLKQRGYQFVECFSGLSGRRVVVVQKDSKRKAAAGRMIEISAERADVR